jgi:hypothetical protein
MTHSLELTIDKTAGAGPDPPGPPTSNKAVVRCIRAWQWAYKQKLANLADDDTEWDAQKAGNLAYLRAIPHLAGYENVRDFIACVAYAEVNDLIMRREAIDFLAAAKVALGALRQEPAAANFEPEFEGQSLKNS